MAKGKVPTRDELLAFIRDSATPVGKREIARAWSLKGDQRIELKQLLRELRDSGEIAADRAKTFRDPQALSDVAVLEIVRVDNDGHLIAVPRRHDEEKDGPPPRIEIAPQSTRSGPAPAVGDRVLANLKRRGNTYEARIIRRLGSGPKKILGLYEEPDGGHGMGLVTPTDRKLRQSFEVRPADKNGAVPGDIVWIEATGGALSRRARVLERIGPMSDPRTVSLIAIAANDIPVEFPKAALDEAERAKARAARPSPRPARRAAGHHRRRGCARLRRRGVRRARPGPSRRLAPAGRDRRRRLVRAPRQAARPRRLPARQLGLFPRPRRADAAGAAFQRPVLAGPREDRPVLVARVSIDAEGHLKRHRFDRAMMRSAARLTYDARQRAIDGAPDATIAPLERDGDRARSTAPTVAARGAASSAARSTSTCPSARSTLGSDGTIAEIGARERLDSHRLIEEFMVAANVAAAETLEQRYAPCLYRVHDQPDAGQARGAARVSREPRHRRLPSGQRLRPRHFNRVLHQVAGTPVSAAGHETVLRSQSAGGLQPRQSRPFRPGAARAMPTSPRRSGAIPT